MGGGGGLGGIARDLSSFTPTTTQPPPSWVIPRGFHRPGGGLFFFFLVCGGGGVWGWGGFSSLGGLPLRGWGGSRYVRVDHLFRGTRSETRLVRRRLASVHMHCFSRIRRRERSTPDEGDLGWPSANGGVSPTAPRAGRMDRHDPRGRSCEIHGRASWTVIRYCCLAQLAEQRRTPSTDAGGVVHAIADGSLRSRRR